MRTKRLDWSLRSLADADTIFGFYAETASFETARSAKDAIARGTQTLQRNPLAYRTGKRGTREYVMQQFPFIIIYRVYPSHIRIIRVLHQARSYFN